MFVFNESGNCRSGSSNFLLCNCEVFYRETHLSDTWAKPGIFDLLSVWALGKYPGKPNGMALNGQGLEI